MFYARVTCLIMYKIQFPANPTLVLPSSCCCCGRNKTDTHYTMNIAHRTSVRRDARIYGVSVVRFPVCNECRKWIDCRLTSIKVYTIFFACIGLILFVWVCLIIFLPVEMARRIILFAVTAVILSVILFLFTKIRDAIFTHINKGKPNDKCKTPPIGCFGTDIDSFILGFENAGYAEELIRLNKGLRQQNK